MGMDHEYELRVSRPGESLRCAHRLQQGRPPGVRRDDVATPPRARSGYPGQAADALPGDDAACPWLDLLRGGAVAAEGRPLPPAPGPDMRAACRTTGRPRIREPCARRAAHDRRGRADPRVRRSRGRVARVGHGPLAAGVAGASQREPRPRTQLCRRLVGHRRPGRADAYLRALVRPARCGATQDLAAAPAVPGRGRLPVAQQPRGARAATPPPTTTSGTTSTGCSSTSPLTYSSGDLPPARNDARAGAGGKARPRVPAPRPARGAQRRRGRNGVGELRPARCLALRLLGPDHDPRGGAARARVRAGRARPASATASRS